MNCEKCKNKKATLFYADEGGGRHALCTACGSLMNKIGQYDDMTNTNAENSQYIPEPTLRGFNTDIAPTPIYLFQSTDEPISCSVCHLTLNDIRETGELGCPECYSAFGELIFPYMSPDEDLEGKKTRMPYSHRQRIERKRSLADLRSKLRSAIEGENFELAAKLRDRIKNLENKD